MAKENNLVAPQFQDPEKAREYLESEVWPNGPVCPHCGSLSKDHYKLEGKSTRPGLYKCKDCREPFTVTVGTVFERSHIPLNKWLMAVYLICSSKKSMSAHQLHRTIGVTYKSAWFMCHRIREAMKGGSGLLGSNGGAVEADETFYGRKPGRKIRRGSDHKHAIFSLVERNGEARSFHVPNITAATLKKHLLANVAKDASLMTDSASQYRKVWEDFPKHDIVNHLVGEYVRGDVHTNTIEGYFGLFKRGVAGAFHHISEQHLQRYMHEFDFRWNYRVKLGYNDVDRYQIALRGIRGKRLTYRRTDKATPNLEGNAS